MTFVTEHLVRFAHVDAAGIVFYPRYFELLNAAIEDYFSREVGVDFRSMHIDHRIGVPTVKLDTDFVAPSRLGDLLQFHIDVVKIGRSSVELAVEIKSGDEVRFRVRQVLVCLDLEFGKSLPWPEAVRPRKSALAA
jgi:4-hydroxybenzoyl-CoA thioesterase